jgi:hypothetical protein
MLEDGNGDSSFVVLFKNPWYVPYLNLKVATDSF